ncbi:methyl-accepting chemotaxis protein [Paraburkholderia xenovorans]|uniref:methyl-accepting chemotaxis protein n=1 Tax=Paraburkholderia xenovorans TaxID=36873 RepID=UPI001558B40F|nr:methyl-accepting chemotaxis protein [Paraburkholderia xenovorans]
MKLSTRLWLIVAVSVAGLLLLAGSFLWALNDSMRAGRREEIKNMLVSARSMVESYARLETDGKLGKADAQAQALRALSNLRAGKSVYYFVRTPEGLMLLHPDPKIVGTISRGKTIDGLADYDAWRTAMDSDGVSIISIAFKKPGEATFSPKLNGVAEFNQWGWWIGTGFFIDDIIAEFFRAARWAVLAVLVIVAGLCVMAYRLIRNVTSSIGGEPADVAVLAQRVADGDLSFQPGEATPKPETLGEEEAAASLASSMFRMRDALRATVQRIQASTSVIAVGTAQLRTGNDNLSQRTEQQAAALEQTAASVEELNATVQQNAESVVRVNGLTRVGVDVASSGDNHVNRIVERMAGITHSAERIRGFVEVVSGIAAQTNILALNAAVEAARAGAQGRGFAVVASEVRVLAQRCDEAVKSISQLIEDALAHVSAGNSVVDQARQSMVKLVEVIREIDLALAQIALASTEQERWIGQVTEAISYIDSATQKNAVLVAEAAASAASLDEQASSLSSAVSAFRL